MEKIRKYCSEKNKKFHGCFMVRIGIVRCSLFSMQLSIVICKTPQKSHRNFIKICIYVMLRGSNCFKMFYSYEIPYLESHLNIISSFSVPLRLQVCSSYLFIFLLSCLYFTPLNCSCQGGLHDDLQLHALSPININMNCCVLMGLQLRIIPYKCYLGMTLNA